MTMWRVIRADMNAAMAERQVQVTSLEGATSLAQLLCSTDGLPRAIQKQVTQSDWITTHKTAEGVVYCCIITEEVA